MSFIDKWRQMPARANSPKKHDAWFYASAAPLATAGICWFVWSHSLGQASVSKYNPTVGAALAMGLVVGFFVGKGWELWRSPSDRRKSRR